MQNKHQFFLLSVSQPPGRGGQAGWDKIPSLSKEIFLGLPLAPQSGALKITPHRDFHPIPYPTHPLIAPRHFCPYISEMENHLRIPTVNAISLIFSE